MNQNDAITRHYTYYTEGFKYALGLANRNIPYLWRRSLARHSISYCRTTLTVTIPGSEDGLRWVGCRLNQGRKIVKVGLGAGDTESRIQSLEGHELGDAGGKKTASGGSGAGNPTL